MLQEDIRGLNILTYSKFKHDSLEFLKDFPFLEWIQVVNGLGLDLSPLYLCQNLKTVILRSIEDVIDFSRFPQLQCVEFNWGKGTTGLFQCPNLIYADIRYYGLPDLKPFQGLPQLNTLMLKESRIERWEGIEALTNLEWLDFAYTSRLKSLAGVEQLDGANLTTVRFEVAKHVGKEAYRFAKLRQLQELRLWGCGELPTLSPFEAHANLTQLDLDIDERTNVLDGDMSLFYRTPLGSFANKRHYKPKMKEIEASRKDSSD